MPSFDTWYSTNRLNPVDTARRAVLCWQRIQDKSSSVTFYDGTTQTVISAGAQTVRLEYEDDAKPMASNLAGGQSPKRLLTILGVRDHPDETVLDTDVKERYEFKVSGLRYRVIDVLLMPGEVQATAERYDGQ